MTTFHNPMFTSAAVYSLMRRPPQQGLMVTTVILSFYILTQAYKISTLLNMADNYTLL